MVRIGIVFVACLIFFHTEIASGEPPPYVTLQPPASSHGRHGMHHHSALARVQPARSYAYGWFGALPRQHWSRHFGYYGQYKQWSAR